MSIYSDLNRVSLPSRWHALTGLYLVGFLNGVTWSIRNAPATDFENYSGGSWVVWLAGAAALYLTARAADTTMSRRDVVVFAAYLPFVLWPEPHVAWFGLTLLAGYAAWIGPPDRMGRAGAAIVLSMTVSMLWAKIVVHFFSLDLEEFDTWLVGVFWRVPTNGNLLSFQNEAGRLIVGWPCTSFANLSLALTLWLTITRMVRPVARRSEWLIAGAVTVSVIAINTVRLSLMTINHHMLREVHLNWGVPVFNAVLLVATCAWAIYGVRKELRF